MRKKELEKAQKHLAVFMLLSAVDVAFTGGIDYEVTSNTHELDGEELKKILKSSKRLVNYCWAAGYGYYPTARDLEKALFVSCEAYMRGVITVEEAADHICKFFYKG